MQTDFLKAYKSARRVGTPLIAIRTPDPTQTMKVIVETMTPYEAAKDNKPASGLQYFDSGAPILVWDAARGIHELRTAQKNNTPDQEELRRLLGNKPKESTRSPIAALVMLENISDWSTAFMLNLQEWWKVPEVAQAIWNLRDKYKSLGSTLVMLTSRAATLPPMLSEDVLVLDQPLPNAEELGDIIKTVYGFVEMELPDDSTLPRATDALIGLSAFPAEQSTALCLTHNGLDTTNLWEKKRSVIEQIRGLHVWRGSENFAQVGGLANVKEFFRQLFRNKEDRPDGIVFTDEIEKLFAGFGTDMSGTTTKSVGTLLSYMEDNNIVASLFYGQRGSGKTMISKAIANDAGVITVHADFAAMESGIVGSTGENIRASLATITAMFRRPLFIATANSWGPLPPELRRRYNRLPMFYFDLPDSEERTIIWQIHMTANKLASQKLPNDDGWSGAEIRNCCELARRIGCSVMDASTYIVPLAVSAKEEVLKLREECHGKFISASYPGTYRFESASLAKQRTGRRISKEEALT